MRTFYFISHPDVEISASVPVPQWPLSDIGKARMNKLLGRSWVRDLTSVYSSNENKAMDGAKILGDHTGLTYTTMEELGENDRSSTGFLEPAEFEATADTFFSSPDTSIRGWETASAAQTRIVNALARIDREDETEGAVGIVSHGAVGTLLYCYLAEQPIDRKWDQPGQGGGNFLTLSLGPEPTCTWWEPID